MIEKIRAMGLILCFLWLVPSLLGDYDPPKWVKWIVICLAVAGALMAFIGSLVLVWL